MEKRRLQSKTRQEPAIPESLDNTTIQDDLLNLSLANQQQQDHSIDPDLVVKADTEGTPDKRGQESSPSKKQFVRINLDQIKQSHIMIRQSKDGSSVLSPLSSSLDPAMR